MCVKKIMVGKQKQFRKCVLPFPRFMIPGDQRNLCVVCLGAEHAHSALKYACIFVYLTSLQSEIFATTFCKQWGSSL